MKKYEEIYNEIYKEIESGQKAIGDKIESENYLAKKYNTTRITVRHALSILEKNNIIIKSQGKESVIINNTQHNKTILLILPDLFNYIFMDIIKNIESTLRSENINLLIACSYNSHEIESKIISNHLQNIDGIIIEPTQVSSSEINKNVYNCLKSIPSITINSKIKEVDIPYLVIEDKKSAKLLTKKVIEAKKKNILVFAKTDDYQGHMRLKGIEDELSSHNNVKCKVIKFGTFNKLSKEKELFKEYSKGKYDCIMFYNDECAYKFMEFHKLSTDDIFITGFDDTDLSNGKYKFLSPYHPKGKMGIEISKMMIQLLNNNKVKSKVYAAKI